MKTVRNFLFMGMIMMMSGWQGNNHADTERNRESMDKFVYISNDRDQYVHKRANTAFKLYPYHNRLNRRHVT